MRGRGFSRKFIKGQRQTRSIVHEGFHYPLKAVWAAAHTPQTTSRELDLDTVIDEATKLGFKIGNRKGNSVARVTSAIGAVLPIYVLNESLEISVLEGKRAVVEMERILRSAAIVAAVKQNRTPICEACGFDFEEAYGEYGKGYIECHHIEPLHTRDGSDEITKEEDLALLCANCHRMVHHRNPHLSLDELKEILLRE